MRHSVERARTATRMVPPLSRRADGAPSGHARSRSTLESRAVVHRHHSSAPGWQRTPPRLPPGFRWIAVRPGAAPPARRARRSLGPTPRYAVIPRWGLADRVDQAPAAAEQSTQTGPSAAAVRTSIFVSVLVLSVVALVYVVRYVLLVINRNTLLNSVVAIAVDWLGILASVAALAAVITAGVMLIRWLIARRAAVFSHQGMPEPRSVRALWAGCVVPLANLLWAPVYVIELATMEEHYARLRRPLVQWWIAWVFSYIVSIFAIITSFATDAQGIANNTVLDGVRVSARGSLAGRRRPGLRGIREQTGRTACASLGRGGPRSRRSTCRARIGCSG